MFIYLMDKQQSPSQNWMPTSSGEAGCRLGMSVGGGGGARLCQKYKIKPRIYLRVLTPTMDSDGGAEAAEATQNDAAMISREGGTVLVAKTMNNLC